MKRNKQLTRRQRDIYRVLRIYSKHWGAGILPFMGLSDEMPDSSQSYEMWQAEYPNECESVSVQGGERLPLQAVIVEGGDRLDSIIRNNGGLEVWQDVFREFRRYKKDYWLILRDISRAGRCLEMDNLQDVADAHHLSLEGLKTVRKRALKKIAWAICDRQNFMITEDGEE